MSKTLLKLCDPVTYFDQFLSENIYPDGRPINSFSAVSFKSGVSGGVGSALVRQGGVTVSCSATANVTLKNDDDLIIPNIEASSDISQKTMNEISDLLNELLTRNIVLTRESLICKGTEDSVPLCWQIILNIRILNSDGCISDAVIGAVVATLLDIKLPYIKLNHAKDDEAPVEKSEIVVQENEKYSLELADFPVSSTFALYESNFGKEPISRVLCDPTAELLSSCKVTCSVVMGQNGILLLRTRGSISDPSLISTITGWAENRRQNVHKAMHRS